MPSALFYSHFAADPYFNMAFDEWMFSRIISCPGAALLRLYSWQVGTITLGYHQQLSKALNFSKLGSTPVIRRITGGRAVYHDASEITYAIAMNSHVPQSQVPAGPLGATSVLIAETLKGFLAKIGIDVVRVERSPQRHARRDFFHTAPCFASSAKNELLGHGRKIVASAQRQLGGALLQHGSIKINGLATHPALPRPDEATPHTLQPVGKERFDYLATLFCREFSAGLGVAFKMANALPESDRQLRKLADVIVRRGLEKR
jgi:lipoate-protein ligase A